MSEQNAEDVLAERLREAAKKLDRLAEAASHVGYSSPDTQRLAGKAEGVRLALSYLEEMKREAARYDGDVRPDE